MTPFRPRTLLLSALALALAACAPPAATPGGPAGATRVLIVGGGASHDFDPWFRDADGATLSETGAVVRYTDVPAEVLPGLADTDVLYLSNNQPLPDPALRQRIVDHLGGGGGLIVGHAASWYNWKDWPEYNRRIVGGGSRGHRKYGEFRVDVVEPGHPVMDGVPASFTLRDELYRFAPEAGAAEIEVLATAREAETGTVYPIVWTVPHPAGRIVVNTLGHDGDAHGHPAYRRILQNSLRWVADAR